MGIGRIITLSVLIKRMLKGDYGHAARIMAQMHGLPQKLGQHLNLYVNTGFEHYFEILCTSGEKEKIPVEKALREINTDHKHYQNYHQASIGQVYRVETGQGRLAVKIKYPGVENKIKHDFRLLKILSTPLRLLPLGNSTVFSLLEQMEQLLLSECDYIKEAEMQEKFHGLFKNHNQIAADANKLLDSTVMVINTTIMKMAQYNSNLLHEILI